jgi:hypothetical protein
VSNSGARCGTPRNWSGASTSGSSSAMGTVSMATPTCEFRPPQWLSIPTESKEQLRRSGAHLQPGHVRPPSVRPRQSPPSRLSRTRHQRRPVLHLAQRITRPQTNDRPDHHRLRRGRTLRDELWNRDGSRGSGGRTLRCGYWWQTRRSGICPASEKDWGDGNGQRPPLDGTQPSYHARHSQPVAGCKEPLAGV